MAESKTLSVLHISYSDLGGGAAIGAYNLHTAMKEVGIKSEMWVRHKIGSDQTVILKNSIYRKIACKITRKFIRLQHSENKVFHSLNLTPSRLATEINATDFDVVNLHWIGNDTMSIYDVANIKKPVFFVLRDMWPFCGSEHYAEDGPDARWIEGYNNINRNPRDSGIDFDKLIWKTKKNRWIKPMHAVGLSTWISHCAKLSSLMNAWKVSTIPNVIDTDIFCPKPRDRIRDKLGIREDSKVILFGALGGGKDPRKGQSYLIRALEIISAKTTTTPIVCIVFGQTKPARSELHHIKIPIKWVGHIDDGNYLAEIYSAADVMVVPSTQESFGKTAAEPQACGCPVVAFAATGLTDVVEHKVTGYLARPFDSDDLANGICWVIEDDIRRRQLSDNARRRALLKWHKSSVVSEYIKIYQSDIAQAK